VKVWDCATQRLVKRFSNHSAPVTQLFRPVWRDREHFETDAPSAAAPPNAASSSSAGGAGAGQGQLPASNSKDNLAAYDFINDCALIVQLSL